MPAGSTTRLSSPPSSARSPKHPRGVRQFVPRRPPPAAAHPRRLHLGQVLRTDSLVALDFEGEPAKSLEERRTPMSPLRDGRRNAQVVRLRVRAPPRGAAHPVDDVIERAAEWSERNRSAFCDGYARVVGLDPRDAGPLLAAYELDKAVYDCLRDTNRPTWAGSAERTRDCQRVTTPATPTAATTTPSSRRPTTAADGTTRSTRHPRAHPSAGARRSARFALQAERVAASSTAPLILWSTCMTPESSPASCRARRFPTIGSR